MLLSSKTHHLASTRKLRARFLGPVRVMEHIGTTACGLDPKGRFKQIHVFHVSNMKKHNPTGGLSTTPPEPI